MNVKGAIKLSCFWSKSIKTVLCILFALFAVFFLAPYFLWDTYPYSYIFLLLYKLIQLLPFFLSYIWLKIKYLIEENYYLLFLQSYCFSGWIFINLRAGEFHLEKLLK